MAKSVKANYLFNLINSASQLLFPLITFPYVSTQFRAYPFERALFSALNRVLLKNKS